MNLRALLCILVALLFLAGAWLVPYTPGNRWGLALSLSMVGCALLALIQAVREIRS